VGMPIWTEVHNDLEATILETNETNRPAEQQ
jgi:hypothetical protein